MHFIGIDLAWGLRRPTGVAVCDETGRLLEVASLRTDAEILALVSPYAEGPCTVALDAPLVVTNATGNRPAEQQLNADFARFDAGAHPTNTGREEFAQGSRAGRLAETLGLDLDPGLDRPVGERRRALEVYPHAATVALFGLGRTLKYKQKPGRDLDLLRRELLALIGLVEGLDRAEPRLQLDGSGWQALREDVAGATRKASLRLVEDQVDAVVCAYVALFASRRPADVTAYGEQATGLIVTPTLPPDLEPRSRRASSPDPVAATTSAVDPVDAVADYALLHPRLVAAEPQLRERVRAVLDDVGIDYLSVTSRTKTVASFAEKARRRADGTRLHLDPMTEITDKIGLRVITYVHDDVNAVAELLHDQVHVIDDRDWGRETASEGRFGYASRHLLIAESDHPDAVVAQVQVRTVLQHAWAEFEHDIRYKGTVPEQHASDFDRRFTLAAGLLELADQEFATIRERLRTGAATVEQAQVATAQVEVQPSGIEPRELAAFLAGQYDDAGWSRADHYGWIAGLVEELGIATLAELADTLRGVDEKVIAMRMDYRHPPGAVRRLDDALLLARGQEYVDLAGNAHRVELLLARLARLADGGAP